MKEENKGGFKSVQYSIAEIIYCKCPHCKKRIIMTEPKAINPLREWKKITKQKIKK